MNDFKDYVEKQISMLVQNYNKIEFQAYISDNSYSIEFFVTINGQRFQNFQMIDEGLFSENDFDTFAKNIAEYIRSKDYFKSGEVNKFSFEINNISSAR